MKSYFIVLTILLLGITNLLAQPSSNVKAKLYFTEAEKLYNQGDFDESLTYVRKTENTLGETVPRILGLKIKIYYAKGDFITAKKHLDNYSANYTEDASQELNDEILGLYINIEEGATKMTERKNKAREEAKIAEKKAARLKAKVLQSTIDKVPQEWFSEGLAPILFDGKWGFINENREIVIPCKYDDVSHFSEGLAHVYLNKKGGMINKEGKEILPIQYTTLTGFKKELAVIGQNGKEGFVNTKGEIVIPCKFEKAWQFSNGLALVKQNNKYGYINKKGDLIISCKYDYAGAAKSYKEGKFMRVGQNEKYGYINQDGEVLIPCQYDFISRLYNGVVQVKQNGKFGLMDIKGNTILPITLDHIFIRDEPQPNGYFYIEIGDHKNRYFINTKGEIIRPKSKKHQFVGDDFSEGLSAVYKQNHWDKKGYVNESLEIVIPTKYYNARKFSDGLAAVSIKKKKKELYGFIDKSGEIVIPLIYDKVSDFCEGVALVVSNGRPYLINKAGKTIALNKKPNSFYTLTLRSLGEGFLFVWEYSIIFNKTGRIVGSRLHGVERICEGLILISRKDRLGIMDNNGRIILPCKYTTITFDKGLLRAKEKEGKKITYFNKRGESVMRGIFLH